MKEPESLQGTEKPNKAEKIAKKIPVNENDYLLEGYVKTLNGTDDEMLVTLLIDGFLVSGLLVGGNRYFQLMLDKYVEQNEGHLTQSIKQLQDTIDNYLNNRFDPDMPIGYFHMLSATFHHPIGRGMPSKGTVFRGKLNKVSGFYLGGWLPAPADHSVNIEESEVTEEY